MKRRTLTAADLDAAILGGLLLSAGGSGMASSARHRQLGEEALERGRVALVSLEEFEDDDELLVCTAIGAPGAAWGPAGARTEPQDAVDAANALVGASGCIPRGVIPGHVPGMYAWTIAASLNIPLADAASNGRAHPTQKMGGMGLASKADAMLWQAASAAGLRAVVHGNLVKTSNVMRAVSVQNGGLINAVRGPFHAGFVRQHGAPRSITFCLALGERMRGNGLSGAADFLKASVLVEGTVAENDVVYREGFDVGKLRVGNVTLGVYNEFMTAERNGERLATFPDFLGSLDPASGEPLAISELKPGRRVAILYASRKHIPLGAGVFDPAVYPEVEAAMGVKLFERSTP